MTQAQWDALRRAVRGEIVEPAPIGFIVDCPWLPNWYGVSIVDYFSSEAVWLDANLKAAREFPEAAFLPGFWSEYGMCTEPSAFGARCAFPANEFPHAHRVIASADQIDDLPSPDPRSDGLLPFVLHRLTSNRRAIEDAGYSIRFAVSRGPLNIASYLMGSTEFLTAMMLEPDKVHRLLEKITGFLASWIELQRESVPSIGGLLLLDDIIGFMGEPEFLEFGMPYFKRLYTPDLEIRFLHNDARCKVSAPHLAEMGVNLFNPGFDLSLPELRGLLGPEVTILGNIPPRDVLAAGTEDAVAEAARALARSMPDRSRVIFSCGGGMPPGVSSANLRAFLRGIREGTRS